MAGDLTAAAQQYVEELKGGFQTVKDYALTTIENAKNTAQNLQRMVQDAQTTLMPKVDAFKAEMKAMLEDMSPVSPDEHKHLMEGYLWTAICLFAFSIAQIVGGLLSPIVNIFFVSIIGTTAVAFILLPIYLYLRQRKTAMDEVERRLFNLIAAITLGAFAGFQFALLHLSYYSPPAFGCCLGVAIAAGVLKMSARTAFLGACVGISMGVFFAYGMAMGLGFWYLLWALAYGAVIAADVQIKIGKMRTGAIMQAEQLLTIIIFTELYAIMYIINGMAKAEAKQEAAAAKKE